jgi:hypothetical protein
MTGWTEEALSRMREILDKLKLTVNEEKTRICEVPEGEFDFLGFTFGRMYSATTGQARMGDSRCSIFPDCRPAISHTPATACSSDRQHGQNTRILTRYVKGSQLGAMPIHDITVAHVYDLLQSIGSAVEVVFRIPSDGCQTRPAWLQSCEVDERPLLKDRGIGQECSCSPCHPTGNQISRLLSPRPALANTWNRDHEAYRACSAAWRSAGAGR